ncbi:hypothetical protein VPH35_140919 [Triticum aestivum]
MEHQGRGAGEKKGVVESITEKLPGGHGDHQQTTGMTGSETHATTATTDGNYGKSGHTGTDGTGENKSIMDKIKDKLPGQH